MKRFMHKWISVTWTFLLALTLIFCATSVPIGTLVLLINTLGDIWGLVSFSILFLLGVTASVAYNEIHGPSDF